MSTESNITAAEMSAYAENHKVISDIDYGFNPTTEEWTVPAIEWEDSYGRVWQYFNTEQEREHALQVYEAKVEAFVVNFRKTEEERESEKELEKYRIRAMKTLGYQFPELFNLK